MFEEKPSNEDGAYRRTEWVIATSLIGALVMLCGLCAVTPNGQNLVSQVRTRLHISDPLQRPPQTATESSPLVVPNVSPTPLAQDSPTPLANSATLPSASTATRAPSPTARLTSTPTKGLTRTPTAKPTLTVPIKPTETPNVIGTALTTIVPTGIVETLAPTGIVGTLIPTGIVATLVPTVNVPACVCAGVDQVCLDGTTHYNVPACGGSGDCQCRGTSLFCPNGSVTLLSPQCLPDVLP